MHSSLRAGLRSFVFPAVALVGVAVFVCGCGSGVVFESAPEAVQGTALHGVAMGGRTPITGSSLYLYAASTAGYGTAATSLLKTNAPGVFTDTSGNGYVVAGVGGNFSITGDYTCPSAATPVYLLAFGGNPGFSGTVSNSAIAEMAALGPCGSLSSSTLIILDELSTVAAVSALGPFLSASGAVATSPSNVLGLTHAFTTATNLKSLQFNYPNSVTPGGLGSVPYQEINTLADVLAACVQTNLPTSSNCNTLFTATAVGGTRPANILQAMLNINRYPAQNVATLYGLVSAISPYQPTLPAQYNGFTGRYDGQPNDWTLAIVYSTSTLSNPLNAPNYLALDSQSNVWAVGSGKAVQFSNSGLLNYTVTETKSQIDTNNYNQVLAVDLNDNLWIDDNSYSVSEITKGGVLTCADPSNTYCFVPGAGTNYGSIFGGQNYIKGFGGIAIDASNNLWVGSGYGSSLVEVNTGGYGLANYAGGGISNPVSVALDTSGNIWLANQGDSPDAITKISPSGSFLSGGAGFTAGGLNRPSAIAFDHTGNAWIGNEYGSSLTKLTSAGTPVSGSPFTGGGLYFVTDVAIDGAGNVWASSFDTAGIAEFSSAGVALSPSLGYFSGNGSDQGSVAIDSSGNVWVSSWDGGSVNELVGVGAPTVNPVSVATKNGTIGTLP